MYDDMNFKIHHHGKDLCNEMQSVVSYEIKVPKEHPAHSSHTKHYVDMNKIQGG